MCRLLINQSTRDYERFYGATSDIVLAVELKRVSIVALYGSENAKWLATQGGSVPDPVQYQSRNVEQDGK